MEKTLKTGLTLFALCTMLFSCQKTSESSDTETKTEEISISISNLSKHEYSVGDSLDLSTIKVNLTYKENGESKEKEISDYQCYLDKKEIQSYFFENSGEYHFSVSYHGLNSESETLYCNTNSLTLPKQYTDKTLVMPASTHTSTIQFTSTMASNNYTEKGYYAQDEIDASYHAYDMGRKSYNNQHFLPSTGNVPLLIVPVSLPGDNTSFTNDELNMINDCFFGNSTDMAFESLHSYYYKSSFGKLNFTFNVSPVFDVKANTEYKNISQITSSDHVLSICQSALKYLKEEKDYDYTKYDSDKDGTIDGVWFIYKGKDSQDMPFWPYTSYTTNDGTVTDPVLNTYGWAGVDFLTQDYYKRVTTTDENVGKDAHVLIHETGHMLGLNDYYSYGNISYSPLGGRDMMDMSLQDHNAYSKLRLGWITPTIVTGDCSLSINSSFYEDQVILIPYQGKKYKTTEDGKIQFNPFDEYLLIELYSDENMNSLDYLPNKATHTEGYGVKLLHADARGGQVINNSFRYFTNPDDILTAENSIFMPISNTDDGSRSEAYYTGISSESAFDEIRIISKNGNYIGLGEGEALPEDSSFFKSGDSFNIDDYKSQFVHGRFDYSIKKPLVSFQVTSLK